MNLRYINNYINYININYVILNSFNFDKKNYITG